MPTRIPIHSPILLGIFCAGCILSAFIAITSFLIGISCGVKCNIKKKIPREDINNEPYQSPNTIYEEVDTQLWKIDTNDNTAYGQVAEQNKGSIECSIIVPQ